MVKVKIAKLNPEDYEWAREDILQTMHWQLEDNADDDALLDTAYDLAYLHAFVTDGFDYSSEDELNELIDKAVKIAKQYAYKDCLFEPATGPVFKLNGGLAYVEVDIYDKG